MDLTLSRAGYDSMVQAARRAAPLEACGLCGGRDGEVQRFYAVENVDASGEHYSMRPEDQFAAIMDMRAQDIGLLAIWHSHPATPARMSAEDLRLAYTPDVVYLILSLANPHAPDLRGFIVEDGRAQEVAVTVRSPKEETS